MTPEERKVQRRAWRVANPERERAATRRQAAKRVRSPGYKQWVFARNLKRDYGLSVDRYNAMLEFQGGDCAICGKPMTGRKNVDHDHITGKVRGLLCSGCNLRLGLFESAIRESMERYLANPPADDL